MKAILAKKAIKELMNRKYDVLDVAKLDVSNRLLVHMLIS